MFNSIKNDMPAKLLLLVLVAALFTLPPAKKANAGIPTIDVAGLVQSVLTALENVEQTLQMIQSYQTQLNQFENQIRNSLNPETWLWNNASQTMTRLRNVVDTIQGYKNTLGSLDNYLDKFKDLEHYKNHPCLRKSGCTAAQREDLNNIREFGSTAVKRVTDAIFRGIEIQQENMESDAQQLEQIQNAATTARGQVEAIQYANQLAANQANQLLQIRSLLTAQHNAAASIQQAQNDIKAQESAATRKLRANAFTPSPPRGW